MCCFFYFTYNNNIFENNILQIIFDVLGDKNFCEIENFDIFSNIFHFTTKIKIRLEMKIKIRNEKIGPFRFFKNAG